MIILKVNKNQGFTLSLKNTIFEKRKGRGVKLTSHRLFRVKDLTSKITTLSEKVNSSKPSISKLNAKIGRLEEKIDYLESLYELKVRKIDDSEQHERRECLRFSGFEAREKEIKEQCDSMEKSYIKNTLKIDIG